MFRPLLSFLWPFLAALAVCVAGSLALAHYAPTVLSLLDKLLTEALPATAAWLFLAIVAVDTTLLRIVRTLRMSEVGAKSRAQRHLGARNA